MPTDTQAEPVAPKVSGIRRHGRYLFSVPLTVQHLLAEGSSRTHGMTLEISEGGMSAIVQGDLRIGEIADVNIPLPAGPLSALAIVRHKTAGHFGFEFLGLSPAERQQLSASTKLLLPQTSWNPGAEAIYGYSAGDHRTIALRHHSNGSSRRIRHDHGKNQAR